LVNGSGGDVVAALHEGPVPYFWVDFSDRDDVVALHGELDVGSAPTLDAAFEFIDGRTGELVLDLADLDFIGSTGLTRLVMLHKRLAATAGRVTLARPQPQVHRVLTLTGLDHVFRIRD
jgi:anti-sigma B factor antagonist